MKGRLSVISVKTDITGITADVFEKLLDLRGRFLGIEADTRLSSENNGFDRLGRYIN